MLGFKLVEASKNIQAGMESVAESIRLSKVEPEIKSMIIQLDNVL